MVKVDQAAHAVLKKYKERLKLKGVRVSMGGALREMDRIINGDDRFSQKDLKALSKARDVLMTYKNPTFSDAIRDMDAICYEKEVKE